MSPRGRRTRTEGTIDMVSDMRDGNTAQAVKLLDHAQELLVFMREVLGSPDCDKQLCDYGLAFLSNEAFKAVSEARALIEKDEERTEE